MGELTLLEFADELLSNCSVSESWSLSDFFKIGFLFVAKVVAAVVVEEDVEGRRTADDDEAG